MTTPATATDELPRVLEVSRFAAARQAEIQALCSVIRDSGNKHKFGLEALPRQLRRRATSHNPYKHRRRPNKKLQALHGSSTQHHPSQEEQAQPEMPRPTNRAMRRRPGLLQAACEDSCCQDLLESAATTETLKPKRLETHIWHAKRMQMMNRWGHVLSDRAVGKGHGSRAFLHALKTSFVMHDSSYSCPLELTGSRQSLLQLLRQVSNVEDAYDLSSDSWSSGSELSLMLYHPGPKPQKPICPITFHTLAATPTSPSLADGSQELVSTHLLKANLDPSASQQEHDAVSRASELAAAQQIPAGSLLRVQPNPMDLSGKSSRDQSDPMGLSGEFARVQSDPIKSSGNHQPNPADLSAELQTDPSMSAGASTSETLTALVWVHPAAVREAWETLTESANKAKVVCISRIPDLRRIQLQGPASDAALASVLASFSLSTPEDNTAESVWSHIAHTGGVAAQVLLDGFAIALRVADPRLQATLERGSPQASPLPQDVRRACTDALFAIQPCLSLLSSASQMWEPLQSSSQQTPPQQVTFQETQSPLQHRVQNQSKLVQQNTNGSVLPPLPESQVSALRQRARLTSLHIVGEDEQEVRRHLGDEEDDAGMLKPYDEEEGVRGARIQIPHELQDRCSASCPMVVMRKGSSRQRPQPCGWSLILPRHWVTPFWQTLVYRGAKIAGQREWGWVSQQLGIPTFPQDFPDCQAAVDLAQLLAADQEAAQQKKPKGKRAPAGEGPCSWGWLGKALHDESHTGSAASGRAKQQLADQAGSTIAEPKPDIGASDRSGDALKPGPGTGKRSGDAAEPEIKARDRLRDAAEPRGDDQGPSRDEGAHVASDRAHGLLPKGWWVAHSESAMWHVTHDSSPTSSCGSITAAAAQGQSQAALDRCLISVRLQMLGKGVCQEGAAILLPTHADSLQDTPSCPGVCADPQGMTTMLTAAIQMTADQVPIDQETQGTEKSGASEHIHSDSSSEQGHVKRAKLAVPDTDTDPASNATQAHTAAVSMASDQEVAGEGQPQAVVAETKDSASAVGIQHSVIGFVTSESVRGVSGGAGPRGLCSLAALKDLYGQQVTTKMIRHSSHGVVVHIKNKQCTKYCRAAVYCAHNAPWQKLFRPATQGRG